MHPSRVPPGGWQESFRYSKNKKQKLFSSFFCCGIDTHFPQQIFSSKRRRLTIPIWIRIQMMTTYRTRQGGGRSPIPPTLIRFVFVLLLALLLEILAIVVVFHGGGVAEAWWAATSRSSIGLTAAAEAAEVARRQRQ